MTRFERKAVAFCNRNDLSYTWQTMIGGYRRMKILADSWNTYQEISNAARRLKNVYVYTDIITGGGVFEGYVYLQDEQEAQAADELSKRINERHNNWWKVYHDCLVNGMNHEAAQKRAEAMFPTPA